MSEDKQSGNDDRACDEAVGRQTSDVLPIDAGALKVDDKGFHGAAEIAWVDVAGVVAGSGAVDIQKRSGDHAYEVECVKVDTEIARRVEAAWRCRHLEAMEGGASIAGGLLPRFNSVAPLLWATAFVMLVWALVSAGVAMSVADSAVAAGGVWRMRVIVGGTFVSVVSVVAALALARYAIVYRRMGSLFGRWEYDSKGLSYWKPDGSRIVLRPLAADFVSPRVAKLNGVRVPLGWMTGGALVASMLLYTGQRAEATVHRDSYAELVFVPVLCGSLWLTTVAARLLAPEETFPQLLTFGAACVTTAVWMAATSKSGKRLRRWFLDGKAMITRLGW